jgi:DnaJ-class molecular chaperone
MADADLAYQILGLSPQANKTQVRQAYRTLVKSLHPDLHANQVDSPSLRRLCQINWAYETLTKTRANTTLDLQPWGDPGDLIPDTPSSQEPTSPLSESEMEQVVAALHSEATARYQKVTLNPVEIPHRLDRRA